MIWWTLGSRDPRAIFDSIASDGFNVATSLEIKTKSGTESYMVKINRKGRVYKFHGFKGLA